MASSTDALLQELADKIGPLGNARLAKYHESAIQTAATAGLVVRPTTVAALTIWNGENVGGKSLVIDRIFSHCLVTAASKEVWSMWYCMHLEMTKPTNGITSLRGTGDGREPNNSLVVVDPDATVLDDGWFPCGSEGLVSETGTTPSGVSEWECNGRLVVPPHHGLSIHTVASTTNVDNTSGVSWWRVQL